jgi:17beta-estradiol 17-dehydrogenase / very-long-chain 3-oxoacyl-CoA reductase
MVLRGRAACSQWGKPWLQAYVDMFSKSLDLEYKQFGISVHNQAPAYVATKMSKIRKPTMDAPSPANWVKAAIRHIGYEPTQCPFPCASHST